MENSNIINGVDHAKFDLMWAIDGGFVIDETADNELIKVVLTLSGLVFVSCTTGEVFYQEERETPEGLRMALPAECVAAGWMYKPPPSIVH